MFDTGVYATREKSRCLATDFIALSGLERFILRIASYTNVSGGGDSTPELFGAIARLPNLLDSRAQLKHLELRLSDDLAEPPIFYTINKVISDKKTWPLLEPLTLENLSVNALDLLFVIWWRAPVLQHLGIGGISLLEGSWEGFFEALAQSKSLSSLTFECDTYLFHHDGADFSNMEEKNQLYEDLENYVVYGGRHPCLDADQPDGAGRDFLREFPPALQDRLFHMNDPS